MFDQETFVERCREIVAKLGKKDTEAAARAQCGWGLKIDGTKVYRDKQIEIVMEADPSKAMLITNQMTRNPVICLDKKGDMFRCHGEARLLGPHVYNLVEGLNEAV